MRTLIINSYAGSLVLGAKANGAEIVGSYEDAGFGLPIQQENFPRLEFRENRADWPDKVSADVLLAHPPCSAFSVQNTSARARGVNSSAFACTKEVLDYGMGNKIPAIAVESVMGALAGAWDVHESYARDHGYHLYRVLKNSCLFGVPQWRERFWALFVRKGAAAKELHLGLRPTFTSVAETTKGLNNGPAPAVKERELETLKRRFSGQDSKWVSRTEQWVHDDRFKPLTLTKSQRQLLFEDGPPEFLNTAGKAAMGGLSMDRVLQRYVLPHVALHKVCQDHVSKFSSCQMLYVNPKGYIPVLLGSSFWFLNGRVLSEKAYKAVMGFPSDYVFPDGHHRNNMLMYLSKGVCPPVARWVHQQLVNHLEGREPAAGGYQRTVQPSGVTGFRIRRSDFPTNGERPELRAEEMGDE